MARINWLADVLRDAGLKVQEVPGWTTRGSTNFAPIGVMVHHTAGGRNGNSPSYNTCVYGRPGIPGPLCHILIARDGTCIVIASGRANHAGTGGPWKRIGRNTGNTYTVGIEIEHVGTAAEPWSQHQVEVSEKATAAILKKLRQGKDYALAHKEWAPSRKVDPYAWNMGAFRADVAAHMSALRRFTTRTRTTLAAVAAALGVTVASLTAVNPGVDPNRPLEPNVEVTAPAHANEAHDKADIVVEKPRTTAPAKCGGVTSGAGLHRGDTGEAVSALQRTLKAKLGAAGNGLVVDGVYGPQTEAFVCLYQQRNGWHTPDGWAGPVTLRALGLSHLSAAAPAPAPATKAAAPKTPVSDAGLRKGARGEAVTTLQRTLKANYPAYARHLIVDGYYGPQTEAVVREFQRRAGLVQDGWAGPVTLRALGLGHLADSKPNVQVQAGGYKRGDTGAGVRRLQETLKAGYPAYARHLYTDGVFGPQTEAVVREFQRRAGLVPDGWAGPVTLRVLGLA